MRIGDRPARGVLARALALLAVTGLVAIGCLAAGSPAGASVASNAQAAVQVATDQGYRTAIAVLDLRTGTYVGAGDDTAAFPSESLVKVMIACKLILTGQFSDDIEKTAFLMITQSDDEAADQLYDAVDGADVLPWVADHYGIGFLGSPPPDDPAEWGSTQINARGMVYLYAAIAADPAVRPWLLDAMSKATEYASDDTYQFFGIPSATTGAAIKQGWGQDGTDAPNAVFNSTGYVGGNRYAVAILTDGPAESYGDEISAVVTAEAKKLMPDGRIATGGAGSGGAGSGATAPRRSATPGAATDVTGGVDARATAPVPVTAIRHDGVGPAEWVVIGGRVVGLVAALVVAGVWGLRRRHSPGSGRRASVP